MLYLVYFEFFEKSKPAKKELNKIDFIYHYKIIYTKKLLGHLWL